MTQLDVTYHLASPPREASALALNSLREVYGIRRVALNERERTVHIEYDATRLSDSILRQLLRRAGLELAEPAHMIVPDEPAAVSPVAS